MEEKKFTLTQLSLTSEILISLILIMIVTIALIGIISLGILEATVKSTIPSRSEILAETTLRTINRLSRSENFSLVSLIPEISHYVNIKDIALVNDEFKNLYGVHDTMKYEEIQNAEEALKNNKIIEKKIGSELFFYLPVSKNNRPIGVVRIKIPLSPWEHRINIYRKLLIMYIFLGSIFIFFLGIYLFRRRIVIPIQSLIYHTQKIAEGNLSTRISPAGGKELVELANSFNIMAGTLEAKQRELKEKIEELERTNIALKEARDEVLQSEKLATIGRMASGIAHELGNPISAISGNIELLEKKLSMEKEKEIIKRMKSDLERMDKIIRELLDFARPKKFTREKINIKNSIEEAIEIIKTQKGFDNIKIEIDSEVNLPEITSDTTQLKQVWINLFLNARDAMPDGGIIKISISKTDSFVRVEFSDTGTGIQKEHLNKIFEPFFTTKEPGKGTGLGLTVVQRIILSMNGKISVESEPLKGTKFTILLPLK